MSLLWLSVLSLFISCAVSLTRTLNDETKARLLKKIDTTADELLIAECSIHNEQFYVQIRPDWSPLGANRFMELINDNFFSNMALFRAINNFLVQFGIPDNVDMTSKWRVEHNMLDDPKIPESAKYNEKIGFIRGMMSYAGSGKDTRSTQMFFTLVEKTDWLGREPWETPFAMIIDNIEILTKINTEYDDKPQQGLIWQQGYEYLRREFPNLTYLDYCNMVDNSDISQLSKKLNMNIPNNDNDDTNVDGSDTGSDTGSGDIVSGDTSDDASNNNNIAVKPQTTMKKAPPKREQPPRRNNNNNNNNDNNDRGNQIDPIDIKHDMSIEEIRERLRQRRERDKRHKGQGIDGGDSNDNNANNGNDNNNENNNNNNGNWKYGNAKIFGTKFAANDDAYAQNFSLGVQIFEFFAIIALIGGIAWGVLRIRKGEKEA